MKAFTLVDVMVTVAIVAVLVAVAMPCFAGAKVASLASKCRSQARENAVTWVSLVGDSQWKRVPERNEMPFPSCAAAPDDPYDLLYGNDVLRIIDQRSYGGTWPACWDAKGEHAGLGVRALVDGSVSMYDPEDGVY